MYSIHHTTNVPFLRVYQQNINCLGLRQHGLVPHRAVAGDPVNVLGSRYIFHRRARVGNMAGRYIGPGICSCLCIARLVHSAWADAVPAPALNVPPGSTIFFDPEPSPTGSLGSRDWRDVSRAWLGRWDTG